MQSRINLALSAAVVLLAGGLVASYVTRPAPGPSEADIRALVEASLAGHLEAVQPVSQAPAAEIDAASLGPVIETFLLDNPRLLERMSIALETEMRAEETERARVTLATMQDAIFDDPDNIVLGNPDGDVTLVEMFDYNCGYCRQVVADVLSLVDEDPNLRVILKEFPILSQGSVDAARIGVLVNRSEADYSAYHTELFAGRGAITAETALAAAEKLGLNRVLLELDMNADDVTAVLQRNYTIAQGLGVSGTPTFIIGNEVIPGAVDKSELSRRIANMRACGQTVCS